MKCREKASNPIIRQNRGRIRSSKLPQTASLTREEVQRVLILTLKLNSRL